MVTSDIASGFGIAGRGYLRVGYAADVNIIDLESVKPTMPKHVADLPGGAMRIRQGANGIRATIVNGVATLLDGQSTGARPGELLRRHSRSL
jgi:N-acyl-D-aspartate/D-glutamate deacylase